MRITLGVTGGVAAYKAAELVRRLQQDGFSVQVVMTRGAREFVTPLAFAALSGQKVITDLFGDSSGGEANLESAIEHIAVAQRTDLLLVAPATADIIAKLARGIADDFLTTLYLASTAPVVLAPAMNVNMWNHAATQENVETLRARGVKIVDPTEGYLACGMTGAGRLAGQEDIVAAVREALKTQRDLDGETVLITAGPTCEDLDPVRYITNRSSGKMGYAVAEAAARRGAKVILVSGPVNLEVPAGVERIDVRTANEMHRAVVERSCSRGGGLPAGGTARGKDQEGRCAADDFSRADHRHSGGGGEKQGPENRGGFCGGDRPCRGERAEEAFREERRSDRGQRRHRRRRRVRSGYKCGDTLLPRWPRPRASENEQERSGATDFG